MSSLIKKIIPKLLLICAFLVLANKSFCANANASASFVPAVTKTQKPITQADSTDSTAVLPVTTTPQEPITQPDISTQTLADWESFVAQDKNKCTPNQTTPETCWIQYTATEGATAPSNTLQCPYHFTPIYAFGNQAQTGGKKLVFYDASFYPKITQGQFTQLTNKYSYVCTTSSTFGTQYKTWYFQSPPVYNVMSDGNYGILQELKPGCDDVPGDRGHSCYEGPRDYAISRSGAGDDCFGIRVGTFYTSAGCPYCCGRRTRYDAWYFWLQCTRKSGYYVPFDPDDIGKYGLVIPAASNKYAPSIVICSKSKTAWVPKQQN